MTLETFIHLIIMKAKDVNSTLNSILRYDKVTREPLVTIKWQRLPKNYVKLNTNASVPICEHLVFGGGMFKNSTDH